MSLLTMQQDPVIGDEILRGDVVDTNFAFVARQAPSCGLKLKRVSIIPDAVKVISREIQKFSNEYDVVVTSGGIGTTHDDLTFEGWRCLLFNAF